MGNELTSKKATNNATNNNSNLPSRNPSFTSNYKDVSSFSAHDDRFTEERMGLSQQLSPQHSALSAISDDMDDLPPTTLPTLNTSISSRRFMQRKSLKSTKNHQQSKSLHILDEDKQDWNINNGVTGKHLSCRIARIASDFWQQNVAIMSIPDKLELGCAIFFGMLSTNKEMKRVMRSNLSQQTKIEETSLKYLDMLGWLLRFLVTDHIDLFQLLSKLGIRHQNMGIHIEHFNPMLESMHEAFSYYFGIKYSIEIKYAMDEIFTLTAQIMTGQDLKLASHLNDIAESFGDAEIVFLKNLTICINSTIGREYLYRYLAQMWCEELVIFLQSLSRFKHQMHPKEKFMVARQICRTSIQPHATFAVNISYETRSKILAAMGKLECQFSQKEDLILSTDFFQYAEMEIMKLIESNHWINFVKNIKRLQLNSLQFVEE